MEAVMYQYKNYLWIQVPEELDQHMADIIRRKCEIVMMDLRYRHIVFDFSKTVFMDSAGIGMILGRYRQISMRGGHVYAYCPGKRMVRIMEMAGLMRIIRIIDRMEQLEEENGGKL